MPFAQRIRDYYKWGTKIDANAVGSFAEIDNGVAKGFSDANYLVYPKAFAPGNQTWEKVFKFITPSQTVSGTLYSNGTTDKCGDSILMSDNKIRLLVGYTASSWNIDKTSSYTLLPNSTYWIKIYFTGSAYNVDISLNGIEYENILTQASSTVITANMSQVNIGRRLGYSIPLTGGSIDLKESYIKINDELWWSGNEYTKIGGWIDDGIVCGFSGTYYLKTPDIFNPLENTWDSVTKVMFTNDSGASQFFFCTGYVGGENTYRIACARMQGGRVRMLLSSNSSTWDINGVSGDSVLTLDLNIWYYVRFRFTGSQYLCDVSTNNADWINYITVDSTTPIFSFNNNVVYGINAYTPSATSANIDLTQSYIKINSQDWWHGTKPVISDSEDYVYYKDRYKMYSLATKKKSYYKYGNEANVDLVGTRAIKLNGIANGFTNAGNQLKFTKYFRPGSDSWERVICFTTGDNFSTDYMNIDMFNASTVSTKTNVMGWRLGTRTDAKLVLLAASGTSSWNLINEARGTTVLQTNTKYYVKSLFTGESYKVLLSKTGEFNGEETLEIDVSSTISIWQGNSLYDSIGVQSGTEAYAFNGAVHLNESYININGERWWSGDDYVAVGYWLDESVAINFNASSYLHIPTTVPQSSNIDCVLKLNVTAHRNYNDFIKPSGYNCPFGFSSSGKLGFYTTSSWVWGSTTYPANTDIWVRITWDGATHRLYGLIDNGYSKDTLPDISNWNLEYTWNNGTNIFSSGTVYLGNTNKTTSEYFNGTIYLKDCFINIDGKEWWRGNKAYQVNMDKDDIFVHWKQPVLTSNGYVGGNNFAVFANSEHDSAFQAWNAFDGNASSGEWEPLNSGSLPAFIGFYNPRRLKVSKLTITNGNQNYITKAIFQGSNDNVKWEDIQEITNTVGTSSSWSVDISNDNGYLYHRIYITETSNNIWCDIYLITITSQELMPTSDTYDYYITRNVSYAPILKTGKQFTSLFESAVGGTYDVEIPEDSKVRITMVGGGGAAAMRGQYDDRGYGWGGGSGGAFIGTFDLPKGTYSVTVGSANNNTTAQSGNTQTLNPSDMTTHDSYIDGVVRIGGGGCGHYSSNYVGAGGASATFEIEPLSITMNKEGDVGKYNSGGKGSAAAATCAGGVSVYGGYGTGQGCRTSEYAGKRSWINGSAGYVKIEVWTQTGNQIY